MSPPPSAAPTSASEPDDGDADWCATVIGAQIDVLPGDHGELPARLLGFEREGSRWRCDSPATTALLADASAGAQLLFVRPYEDPLVGPRRVEFHVASDGPAIRVRAREVTVRDAQRDALALHARLFHAMHEGVLTVAHGAVAVANPAAAAMLGYAPDGLAGVSLERLGTDLAALLAPLAAPADASRTLGLARADGGTCEASVTVRALPEPGTHLLVLRDVTERRRLERELLATERRERERVGRDLHDGIGQELTAVALLLKGLASRLRSRDASTAGEIEEILTLVNGVIGGTRSIARGLYEASLPASGLVGALDELARCVDGVDGCRVEFRPRLERPPGLEHAQVVELYRIAQEAVENARRHAPTPRIAIGLESDAHGVVLVVDDDGPGLPEDAGARGGMGLSVMRYRAHVLGTELVLAPAPTGGTRVECRVRRAGLSRG